jgi:membrane-bound metal-dependent hydrolase YbcI (DUF457 family)
MYLFGHLGLGYLAVKPFWRRVPLVPLLLGCLLPDLQDKPLYYGLCWLTGKHGEELGLISGTRTFGHTLLFLSFFLILARVYRSREALALALGIATHLFLDNLVDFLADPAAPLHFPVLLWPAYGWNFPVMPFPNFLAQLGHWLDSTQVRFEAAGLVVLSLVLIFYARDFWRARPRATK